MATAPRQRGGDQGGGQQDAGLIFEQFAGMNTAMTRAGVPDEQAYWFDGFMPVTPRQLRTLWGAGDAVWTCPNDTTIIMYGFYNLGPTPYAAVFLSDGSVVQLDMTGNASVILPTGTIIDPSITTMGISQWGEQYLLIVSTQTNGYWVWDGHVIYDAGSLAPQVTITDGGSAYQSSPFVDFTGGHGSGAAAVATVEDGQVVGISITNAGSGYLATDSVSVVMTGGTLAGSGANVVAIMRAVPGGSLATVQVNAWTPLGGVRVQPSGLNILNRGAGYSRRTSLSWQYPKPGSWETSPPGLAVSVNNGTIDSVHYVSTAVWDATGGSPFPTIAVNDPGVFEVGSVSVVSAGSNYSPATTINIAGGASPSPGANLVDFIVSGSIASVGVLSGGNYASVSPVPSITIVDTARNATATVDLMAIGISGNAVQTYQGHVWVFNGSVYNFTAPGSVWDFSTANGGGSGQSSDSFLKVGYTAAVQTNGFLFVIGDNSMNYISGVQTTGTPPTTSFTNQNSDPEIGTPYPASVTTLGQELFIANDIGIFVSAGGDFNKRSEALDGVYFTVPRFGGLQLSAAKATIFGKRVWMVLVPVIDPINGVPAKTTNSGSGAGTSVLHFADTTGINVGDLVYDVDSRNAIPPGTTVTAKTSTTVDISVPIEDPGVGNGDSIVFFVQKLFMTNGRQWWASMQDVTLTFIASQEIASVYTAWGTDGTSMYRLFSKASSDFSKIAQTKFWDDPGYEMNKTASRFWSLWQCYSTSATFTLDVDAVGLDENGDQFANSASYSITAAGALNTITATKPQAVGQQGILLGMTIFTMSSDMALISAKLLPDTYQYRG